MVMILDRIGLQDLQMKYLFFFLKSIYKVSVAFENLSIFSSVCNWFQIGRNDKFTYLVYVIFDSFRRLERERGRNVKIRETPSSDNFSNFPSLSSIGHLILFRKIFPIEMKIYDIYETIWNPRVRRAFFRS